MHTEPELANGRLVEAARGSLTLLHSFSASQGF